MITRLVSLLQSYRHRRRIDAGVRKVEQALHAYHDGKKKTQEQMLEEFRARIAAAEKTA